jgi:hypothetical protein
MTCSGRSPGSRVITPLRLPGSFVKDPVAFWRRTHRLQLRAQLRIWLAVDKQRTAPNSHLPINVIDKPEPTDLKRSPSFCQRNRRPPGAIPEFRGQSVCFMQHPQIPSRRLWDRAAILAAPASHAPIDNTGPPSMLSVRDKNPRNSGSRAQARLGGSLCLKGSLARKSGAPAEPRN